MIWHDYKCMQNSHDSLYIIRKTWQIMCDTLKAYLFKKLIDIKEAG